MRSGDCAAWKAGVRNGHHLINRSSSEQATFLVVGTRDDADWGEYPDIDLKFNPARYDRTAGAGRRLLAQGRHALLSHPFCSSNR